MTGRAAFTALAAITSTSVLAEAAQPSPWSGCDKSGAFCGGPAVSLRNNNPGYSDGFRSDFYVEWVKIFDDAGDRVVSGPVGGAPVSGDRRLWSSEAGVALTVQGLGTTGSIRSEPWATDYRYRPDVRASLRPAAKPAWSYDVYSGLLGAAAVAALLLLCILFLTVRISAKFRVDDP